MARGELGEALGAREVGVVEVGLKVHEAGFAADLRGVRAVAKKVVLGVGFGGLKKGVKGET